MRLFVTGASGFIGGRIAAKAVERGHEVFALSRSERSDEAIRKIGATPVRGQLGSIQRQDFNGAEAVLHAAAKVEAWGPVEEFWRDNVEGTVQLAIQAKNAGVSALVHIGTEAALFRGQDMVDIDETAPLALDSPFPYSKTKAAAEKQVLAQNEADGSFRVMSLRPRLVWGPGDQTILPTLIGMTQDGRFSWIDGGQAMTSTTHVDNIVHAFGLMLAKGQGGQAYFITDGPPVRFRDFATALAATAGVTLPARNLPGFAARGIAAALDWAWRSFGLAGMPPLDPFTAAIMSRHCTISIAKAERELGYAPVVSRADGLLGLGGAKTAP